MSTLCVILARAGSKGLPGKNTLDVCGRPMIAWTIDEALSAQGRGVVDRVVVSTDGDAIAQVAHGMGVEVVLRPDELASDTATVDAAARHTVEQIEDRTSKIAHVVILYGNVPARPADLIDRAVAKLKETGCDSVQSVAPVGKNHPYWMKRVDGDRLLPYEENDVHRRQDLPAVYMLDGGVIAVTRAALFTERDGEPHAFLGADRRAVITEVGAVVDIDVAHDLPAAERALKPSDAPPEPLAIGGRAVGRGEPVYVIAELGVNHDGSVERALELTYAAHKAGASAVKLQLFDPDLLFSAEAELAGYQQGAADDPHAMLRALRLGVGEMQRVKALAHELGMGFVVTPFSLENIGALRELDVDAVKIASPDCVNAPLLDAVVTLGKPMLVSTGATSMGEIGAMRRRVRGVSLVVMHCVSAYPTPLELATPGVVGAVAGGAHGGYSDHTDSVYTGMLASSFGAVVIEKHLTYDRGAVGPDHAASLDPEQFAEYVRLIDIGRRATRNETFDRTHGPHELEADVRRVSRQSVCAVRDLKAGDVVVEEDVTVKRPGTGIPAARLHDVVGKALRRDVKANELLHDGDVEPG